MDSGEKLRGEEGGLAMGKEGWGSGSVKQQREGQGEKTRKEDYTLTGRGSR